MSDQLLKINEINNNQKQAIVLLHGYGANAQDLAPIEQAVKFGKDYNWYFIEAPYELSMGYMMKSLAWFSIEDKMMAGGNLDSYYEGFSVNLPKGFTESLASLKETFENISSKYSIVNLGGFSQGSMMSLHLYNAIDELQKKKIKQLYLLSCVECANTLYQNISGKVFIFQSHGTQDPVLPYKEGKKLNNFLETKFFTEFLSFNGGHEIPMEVLRAWEEFICKNL